jgi:hypothetical protein
MMEQDGNEEIAGDLIQNEVPWVLAAPVCLCPGRKQMIPDAHSNKADDKQRLSQRRRRDQRNRHMNTNAEQGGARSRRHR